MTQLLVNEIYHTLVGESRFAGLPAVLVRLTGCHRRCSYCDTEYAFAGGERLEVAEICARVATWECRRVLVTGGEPLLQEGVFPLLERLLADGFQVLLETSGTRGGLPLASVPPGVHRIVDIKTPGSGVTADQIDWSGIAGLGPADELKLVCCDRGDYEWARDLVRGDERLPAGVPLTFAAAQGRLEPRELAGWVLADRLEARVQARLHRVLWPDRDRGV